MIWVRVWVGKCIRVWVRLGYGLQYGLGYKYNKTHQDFKSIFEVPCASKFRVGTVLNTRCFD